MKLKLSGIPGQGNVHKTNNHQDDHLTISVPTPSLKPPLSVSPCFSSKKVEQIRLCQNRYQLMDFAVHIEEFEPAGGQKWQEGGGEGQEEDTLRLPHRRNIALHHILRGQDIFVSDEKASHSKLLFQFLSRTRLTRFWMSGLKGS